MAWMVAIETGEKYDPRCRIWMPSTTVLGKGALRRLLDGIMVVEAKRRNPTLLVLEHKYGYYRLARMQLCSAAFQAWYNLLSSGGKYYGKSLRAKAVLVVHGPSSARKPPSVAEAARISGKLGDYDLTTGRCVIIDLRRLRLMLWMLRKYPEGMALWVAMGLLGCKNISDDLVVELLRIADQIKEKGRELTSMAILSNLGLALENDERLDRLALKALGGRKGKKTMQNFLERMAAKGEEHFRAKGEQEGLQKGLQKGLQEGKVEMLLNVARKKFGALPKQLEALLQAAKPEEIDDWLDRLVHATSIEEAMEGNGSWGNGVPA